MYCRLLSKTSGYDIQSCKCGENLVSYPLSGAKDIALVAVCGYVEESWGTTGAFYLKGNIFLSGEIRREETETFGDWPTFRVSKTSMHALPSRERSLRFSNEKSAIKKFQIPSLSADTACWSAKANIYLKKLYVLEGPGTDADGSYIIDFAISKVGPFRKCNPSE